MGRVLIFVLIAVGCIAIGYAAGRMRNRGEDGNLAEVTRDRDKAHVALQTAQTALRSALQDPGLSAGTTITLDDARQTVSRALPKELRS